MHQNTVVLIQRNHIGDGAQGHKVQILSHVGLRNLARGEVVALPQRLTYPTEQVIGHTHARHGFTGKGVVPHIWIHQGMGIREHVAGQMMIGDHHIDTHFVGQGHSIHTGHTVVYGNNHIGCQGCGKLDYFR